MGEESLLMNLTERLSVCIRSNCQGFWLRVFTPVYSRNIWSELAVIVGFAETTVCSARREKGKFCGKRDAPKSPGNSQNTMRHAFA